jgi:hypothetical protein
LRTEVADTSHGIDAARRKLILGALALPFAGLLARGASAGETTGLAARVEAIAAPLVARLGFSAQRLDGGRMVLAVFTKSSSTPVADRDRAIAETGLALYDHFAT